MNKSVKPFLINAGESFQKMTETYGIPEFILIDAIAHSALELYEDVKFHKKYRVLIENKGELKDWAANVAPMPRGLLEGCIAGASIVKTIAKSLLSTLLDKTAIEKRLADVVNAMQIIGDDITPQILAELTGNLKVIIEDSKQDHDSLDDTLSKRLGIDASPEQHNPQKSYEEFHAKRRKMENSE